MRRAAELATEAGQLPADIHNDHAFVVTAALQANSGLVQVVDFLPVRTSGTRTAGRRGRLCMGCKQWGEAAALLVPRCALLRARTPAGCMRSAARRG